MSVDEVALERLDVEGLELLRVVEVLAHRIRRGASAGAEPERSSWFGHQSWFVLGRVALGSGDGIAGFSLSLPLSVTSLVSPFLGSRLVAGAQSGHRPQ